VADRSHAAAGSKDAQDQVVHEYDGIQEFDNRLPNWWLATLYGAIAFALGYWVHYEGFRVSPSPSEEYRAEVAAAKAAEAEKLAGMGEIDAPALEKLAKDDSTLATGKEVFGSTCAACHAATGGGGIGPNLTDGSWLHGGKALDVYRSVRDGWAQKGMPAWGPQLGEQRVRAVAAYVVSLRNTNVAGGKPAQGEPAID
jgi:cytochrome c oxidase cbb3-type subunit 3